MLAYLFWHAPRDARATGDYERGLSAFHARMAEVPVPGFLRSGTGRVSGLPWMDGPGYEDWYLVEDYASLGTLNAGAVDGRHRDAHDPPAHAAGFGAGGLYALVDGDAASAAGPHVAWLTKPDGAGYPEFVARLAPHVAAAGGALWQRQMVFGPGLEFRITADRAVELGAEPAALRSETAPL